MNSSLFRVIVSALVSCIGTLPTMVAQSCQYPPCSPNPVPCSHCTGTWTDDGGAVWTVSSNSFPSTPSTYAVTGTVQVPSPPGCAAITYSVNGSITNNNGNTYTRGTTTFTWTATSPSPSGTCQGYTPAPQQSYSGTIANDGCDTAGGTWTRTLPSGGTLSGGFSMTKPSDTAVGETSAVTAWWSVYPTVLLFEGNVTSSNITSLAGRQVFESQPSAGSDTCWFPAAAADNVQQYHLTGGGWYVGYYFYNNKYSYDYIGFAPDLIQYYRNKGRPPCLASAPQTMSLYTRDTLSSSPYANNTLYINLPDYQWVGVARNNVEGWRQW